MKLDDSNLIKKLIEIHKKILLNKNIGTLLGSTNDSDCQFIISLFHSVIAWIISNEDIHRIDFPIGSRTFQTLKKLTDASEKNEDESAQARISAEIEVKLREFLLKDNQRFYDVLAGAMYERDASIKSCEGEIFILSLRSIYKDISYNQLAIAVNGDKSYLLMDDGKEIEVSLCEFIKDYYGGKDESILNSIIDTIKENDTHVKVQNILNNLCQKYQSSIDRDYNLKNGAVMFCDFLGWKGLWRNSSEINALTVANKLVKEIEQKVSELSSLFIPLHKYFPISKVISISDTIAIMTPQTYNVTKQQLLELYAKIGKFILERAILDYPIRGAFTLGEFNYANNIMIGPAIDEAASWHETADWIGIILTPSAQFEYEEQCASLGLEIEEIAKLRSIPLKNLKTKLEYCIKWQDTEKNLLKLIHKTKALVPELANKYINTNNFFKELNSTGVVEHE